MVWTCGRAAARAYAQQDDQHTFPFSMSAVMCSLLVKWNWFPSTSPSAASGGRQVWRTGVSNIPGNSFSNLVNMDLRPLPSGPVSSSGAYLRGEVAVVVKRGTGKRKAGGGGERVGGERERERERQIARTDSVASD